MERLNVIVIQGLCFRALIVFFLASGNDLLYTSKISLRNLE